MHLHHLHLPNLTSYTKASALQTKLVNRFLAHKKSPSKTPQPHPTILTAEFHPTYTCGRREVGNLSEAQKEYLTAPSPFGQAEFHEALRGGQTTYHGPGQLVAYPILDLKRHNLGARCYVHFLESTVMRTCAAYGISTLRTANPGVWVTEDRKVCAVGVHLRRFVSSHGIGLNVHTELGWFERIVACGLEGKKATSLVAEGVGGVGVEEVGERFVELFAEGLVGCEGVRRVGIEVVEGD